MNFIYPFNVCILLIDRRLFFCTMCVFYSAPFYDESGFIAINHLIILSFAIGSFYLFSTQNMMHLISGAIMTKFANFDCRSEGIGLVRK